MKYLFIKDNLKIKIYINIPVIKNQERNENR